MLLLARSLVLVLASCRLSSSYQATTYTLRILASTSSTRSNRHFKLSSNANMFGGSPDPSKEVKKPMSKSTEEQTDAYKSKAAKLRQEAAEMEVALREEARAKGLSEEMINKLVPIRAQGKPVASEALMKAPAEAKSVAMSTEEVRSKLGFLNSGDAVRFTSEMDRLQVKGIVALWNSKDMSKLSKADFVVSNAQLKTKTKIDSVKLKLDDVGFAYQNGLVIAIAFGTVFGVASSFIGGQIGFLLGYASALFPILLVGVGSIAPAAIGDVLRRVNHLTNAEAKDKYFLQNGYACGLPVSTFSSNGLTNECEFFQLRPDPAQSKPDNKLMFSKSFDQLSISRCVMTCLGVRRTAVTTSLSMSCFSPRSV